MPLLSATNLSKSYGAADIFTGVSLSVPNRARIGLVGPNGIGKTTLMRILLGQEEPSSGEVQRSRGMRMGYLPQNATLDSDRSLWEELLSVFDELITAQKRLAELEHSMAQEQDEARLEVALEAYGRLQADFERQGGYTYEARIRQTVAGLGFSQEDYSRPLRQLSGGQRTRALLAKLLLSSPDLLMLDEPTNHLDIAATEWLESYLREWEGAVMLISHDRYFLDQVTDTIIELFPSVNLYHGNYSAYIQQRQARWDRLQQIFTSEKEQLDKDLDYVKRNISGQNVRQAKGRLKRLSRKVEAIQHLGIEAVHGKNWSEIVEDADVSENPMGVDEVESIIHSLKMPSSRPLQLKLHLKSAPRSGDLVVRTQNLQVGYLDEGKPLFSVADMILLRGECAGVVGPNGAGKTTFLKTLLGQIPPYSGEVVLGANLHLGYFAQAHESLNPEHTLMAEIEQAAPNLRPGEIRDYLAKFLFSGDDVYKKIAVLSGGERGRLALACLALTDANLLLLDEPTNHLDLPSQEVLQTVLADFNGTILLVSHDRYLIDALATQIWEVNPEAAALRVFQGSYSDFRALRQAEQEALRQEQTAQKQAAGAIIAKESAVVKANGRANNNRERARRQRLIDIEAEIADLEASFASISKQLESTALDPAKAHQLGQDYMNTQSTLEQRMQEWGQLSEEE